MSLQDLKVREMIECCVKPLGHFVLIEMDNIDNVSAGGIIKATNTEHMREQNAADTGTIIAFGPLAYAGFTACDSPEDWGVAIGDRVEYERYEGKGSRFAMDGSEPPASELRLRYIPDSKIIGKVE